MSATSVVGVFGVGTAILDVSIVGVVTVGVAIVGVCNGASGIGVGVIRLVGGVVITSPT